MGSTQYITPWQDSNLQKNFSCCFNDRLYMIYQNTDDSITYLRKINSSFNGWDWEIATPVGHDPLFLIVFNGHIYLSSLIDGNKLWRLNDLEDAIIEVADNTRSGEHTLCVFDNKLYSCVSSYGELYELNTDLGTWVLKASDTRTLGPCISYNGYIYTNCSSLSSGLLRWQSSLGSSFELVNEDSSIITELCVFNGSLYGSTYSGELYKLIGSNWQLLVNIGDSIQHLLVFGNRLYLLASNILQLNETEDGVDTLVMIYSYLWGYAICQGHLYFITEYSSTIFQYFSIDISFYSDVNSGTSPVTVKFTQTVTSDYPIVSQEWSFGDGITTSDTDPTHEFIRGTYNITLTITNTAESRSFTQRNMIDSYDGGTYNISTIEELQQIGSPGNANTMTPGFALHDNYNQTNDIDASATSGWDNGAGFLPVAYTDTNIHSVYNYFSGTYNGNNYSILNLHIYRPITNYVALFSQSNNATFLNINISNASISGSSYPCFLSSYNEGNLTITNCRASGEVISHYSPNGNSQGLLGYCNGPYGSYTISGCYVTATLNNIFPGSQHGGLGINVTNGSVTDCHVNITIINGGGQFSGIFSFANNTDFLNCDAEISIESNNGATNAGGFLGYISGGSFINCHVTGDIVVNGLSNINTLGGFLGWGGDITIDNCSAKVDIIVNTEYSYSIGGFTGYCYSPMTNCSYEGNINITNGISGANWIALFAGYCGSSSGGIVNCHANGNLTINVPNGTGDNGGFLAYSGGGDFINCYVVGSLIINTNQSVNNIGGFAGNFFCDNIIDCFAAIDVSVNGSNSSIAIGGFLGYAYINETILRCYATGNVTGGQNTGGFAGYLNANNLSSCFASGNVLSVGTFEESNMVGGFAARLTGNISNCYASGNVNNAAIATEKFTGGFAGYSSANISNCYSSGLVE